MCSEEWVWASRGRCRDLLYFNEFLREGYTGLRNVLIVFLGLFNIVLTPVLLGKYIPRSGGCGD